MLSSYFFSIHHYLYTPFNLLSVPKLNGFLSFFFCPAVIISLGKVLINCADSLSWILFPKACIPKGSQAAKPCRERKDLNKSDCLREKCCYSSSQTSSFRCFAPLKDGKFILLHFLSFYLRKSEKQLTVA